MNSEEYISAVEKDYSYGYTQQKGRWHGEEQNEMRVYQRYGGMLRNFIRNSYPSDMVRLSTGITLSVISPQRERETIHARSALLTVSCSASTQR